jgi:hypothetical protein
MSHGVGPGVPWHKSDRFWQASRVSPSQKIDGGQISEGTGTLPSSTTTTMFNKTQSSDLSHRHKNMVCCILVVVQVRPLTPTHRPADHPNPSLCTHSQIQLYGKDLWVHRDPRLGVSWPCLSRQTIHHDHKHITLWIKALGVLMAKASTEWVWIPVHVTDDFYLTWCERRLNPRC